MLALALFSLMELMWLRLKLLVDNITEVEKFWLLRCKNMGAPSGMEVDNSLEYQAGLTYSS